MAGLLERSARGLQFPAGIRRRRAADEVERVFRLSGLPRLLGLLSLLEMLAGAAGRPICGPAFAPRLDRSDQERMERVCRHIHGHLDGDVRREELARLAGLSPRTFSRYFGQKTGKTLPAFVNELRVSRACRLLLGSELPVVEVALRCGFQNLSNFNEQFRRLKRASPREFRRAQHARIVPHGLPE